MLSSCRYCFVCALRRLALDAPSMLGSVYWGADGWLYGRYLLLSWHGYSHQVHWLPDPTASSKSEIGGVGRSRMMQPADSAIAPRASRIAPASISWWP